MRAKRRIAQTASTKKTKQIYDHLSQSRSQAGDPSETKDLIPYYSYKFLYGINNWKIRRNGAFSASKSEWFIALKIKIEIQSPVNWLWKKKIQIKLE